MITPTKFTSLDESVLGKAPTILQALDSNMSIHELYRLVEKRFEDAGEFYMRSMYCMSWMQFKLIQLPGWCTNAEIDFLREVL